MKSPKRSLGIIVILFTLCTEAHSSLSIVFDFTPSGSNSGDDTLSQANQDIFTDAADFWTAHLTGYLDGTSRTLSINATAFSEPAVNGSILLGSAGPTLTNNFSAGGSNFTIATEGSARFNVNTAAVGGSGLLNAETIRHEIGHILGFGTIFNFGANNLYVDGSGEYTGVNGIAAFNREFGQNLAFVPIELDGGPGTADGHLNEGNTPEFIVQSGVNAGQNIDDTLLSGNLSGSSFLSDTTLGIFQDLGFTVTGFNTIPEPTSTLLFGIGSLAFIIRRRR